MQVGTNSAMVINRAITADTIFFIVFFFLILRTLATIPILILSFYHPLFLF